MPGAAAEMPFAWPQAMGQVIRVGFEVARVGDENSNSSLSRRLLRLCQSST
jgi:hypothetical protein